MVRCFPVFCVVLSGQDGGTGRNVIFVTGIRRVLFGDKYMSFFINSERLLNIFLFIWKLYKRGCVVLATYNISITGLKKRGRRRGCCRSGVFLPGFPAFGGQIFVGCPPCLRGVAEKKRGARTGWCFLWDVGCFCLYVLLFYGVFCCAVSFFCVFGVF